MLSLLSHWDISYIFQTRYSAIGLVKTRYSRMTPTKTWYCGIILAKPDIVENNPSQKKIFWNSPSRNRYSGIALAKTIFFGRNWGKGKIIWKIEEIRKKGNEQFWKNIFFEIIKEIGNGQFLRIFFVLNRGNEEIGKQGTNFTLF